MVSFQFLSDRDFFLNVFFFFSVVVSFPVISSGGDGLVGLPGLNQLIAEDETKTLQDFNSYM